MKQNNEQHRSELIENIFHNFHIVRRLSDNDSRCSIRQFGISSVQASILILLVKHGPKTMTEISSHLAISRGGTTQLIDKLIDESLIERAVNESDRRITSIQISEVGIKKLEEIREGAAKKFRAMFQALDEDELIELNRLAEKLATKAREAN